MTKIGKILGYFVAISIILVIPFFLYFSWGALLEASTNVKLGVLTAAVSVFAFVYNNARQQAREIASRHFSEKREAYRKFFDLMFAMVASQGNGEPIPEKETISRMREVAKEIMIWGNADTINAYNDFLVYSATQPSGDPKAIFGIIEELLRNMRKELGHSDSRLKNLALTKLLVKGDEHHNLD